jgi:uncharacterized protein YrzB (UPF0473 family)
LTLGFGADYNYEERRCIMENEKDFEMDQEFDMNESIVVMTDEEGNEKFYREEVLFPVGDNTFAVLVELRMTEEGDIEDLDEEADIFMAKVEIDEDGEETYMDPTDEEFEAALAAYEELFDDEDEDEAE